MIKKLSEIDLFRPEMLSIDEELFAERIDRQPFALQHQLDQHPLLRIERLVELAQRLPEHQREYVFAKKEFETHDDVTRYKHAADNDELSTADMIDAIETQNIVIVLRNVESDPEYGRFVNECLDSLSGMIRRAAGGLTGRESFIFISPPQAYTPYHYDPEQNFFMQVRGRKQMAIYDVTDRSILTEDALDHYYNDGQLITPCPDGKFADHELFDMHPGDGVYVPVTAPHWVRTLDEISISISINFRTPSSIRRDRVFRFNRWLRKMGLKPRPVSPQANSLGDRLKSSTLGIPAAIRKMLRR